MLSARNAFAGLNSGIGDVVSATEKALAAGKVAQVYENPEKPFKGSWREFLVKYKLLSATPVKGSRVGGRGAHLMELQKIAPREWEQLEGLRKTINEKLEAAKATIRYQPFIRDLRAEGKGRPRSASAAAPGVAATGSATAAPPKK